MQLRRLLFTLVSASVLAVMACKTDSASDGGAGGAAQPLPCDVDEVLATKCQSCHGAEPAYGAPMSLVTTRDLLAPAPSDDSKRVIDRVSERIHADKGVMPPPPNAALTEA